MAEWHTRTASPLIRERPAQRLLLRLGLGLMPLTTARGASIHTTQPYNTPTTLLLRKLLSLLLESIYTAVCPRVASHISLLFTIVLIAVSLFFYFFFLLLLLLPVSPFTYFQLFTYFTTVENAPLNKSLAFLFLLLRRRRNNIVFLLVNHFENIRSKKEAQGRFVIIFNT